MISSPHYLRHAERAIGLEEGIDKISETRTNLFFYPAPSFYLWANLFFKYTDCTHLQYLFFPLHMRKQSVVCLKKYVYPLTNIQPIHNRIMDDGNK